MKQLAHPKIAYIMSRFPHLPETFILREMNAMAEGGWPISLYPLILQDQEVIHSEASSWVTVAKDLPFLSWNVLAANGRYLKQNPVRFLSIWGQTLKENLQSPNFFLRALALLPKAAYAAQLMQQEGIKHIHAHYATHPALVAWIIHRLTDIPYSMTVHAHDIFVRTAMLKTKIQAATFVAAISEFNRDYLEDLVGDWVRDKIYIVHCGILPEKYLRSSNSLESGKPIEIINIGSLQPYKGQQYLIEACAYLRDWNIPFQCRIIGEGEERHNLEQLIVTHHLETQVKLLGAKTEEEVAALLPAAHCYIQPSIITPSGKMEGIPVSIMEALACELPVIATELSGIPELVKPNESGYLVPPADALTLASTIAQVHQNYEAAKQMAVNGRRLVLQDFELKNNACRLSELVERSILLASRCHDENLQAANLSTARE
jgi:glycosyltransferase involved in cell wall biosynthesis